MTVLPVSLTGVSSMATRALLAELAQAYTQRTGVQVHIRSMGGVDAAQRLRAGDAFDVVVLSRQVIDALAAEGRLLPDGRMDVAISAVAVAVRAGASPPDIGDAEAVRATLLQARSIGFSTGPSGEHLLGLIAQWGLSEVLAPRLRRAPPGVPVASLIAGGEVEIGVQQLSELQDQPGVAVLGPLPADVAGRTVFAGAVAQMSRAVAEARALLAFLGSSETVEAKRRHGMEPAP